VRSVVFVGMFVSVFDRYFVSSLTSFGPIISKTVGNRDLIPMDHQ